jgi:hypothetical protein
MNLNVVISFDMKLEGCLEWNVLDGTGLKINLTKKTCICYDLIEGKSQIIRSHSKGLDTLFEFYHLKSQFSKTMQEANEIRKKNLT